MKKELGELLEEVIKNLYGESLEGLSPPGIALSGMDTLGVTLSGIEKMIEIPADSRLGDYSLPCFRLAGQLKKSPKVIAEEMAGSLNKDRTEIVVRAEAVKGYLNIFLNRKLYIKKVLEEAFANDYGSSEAGKGKTICMDYSSPNIAKNFHVGHLRTTIIGNSLYKLYSKLGYSVVRINHLGDWGTQFGKQIVAYKNWSSRKAVEEGGIAELLRVYIKFDEENRNEIYSTGKEPSLQEEARAWFAKMEQGDEEALALWKWFKEISLKEFERIYKLLKIEFDSYQGESFYMDKVPALVAELRDKHLLEESDGAGIIKLDEYHMPPCLITKKDGSSIYHSRDLAAAIYRKQTYDFTQCLYVTGVEQKLHFAQVFKALEVMGYEWAGDMHHIPYGLVSLGGEKLSTRKGNVIYAEEILKEAVSLARAAIEEKNPNLTDKEETAGKIGIGAVVFQTLVNQLIKDVSFRWEEVLNFDGMTAPYIQYTYARAGSILRKAGLKSGENIRHQIIAAEYLEEDSSYELVKLIGYYPDVIKEAAEKYEPSILARYAYSLAVRFNKFYQECRIVTAEEGYREARLLLCHVVQGTIKDALSLLGIECPEEM